MKEITVICPIYNEQENIKEFIKKFNEIFIKNKKFNFSILFSDNASIDGSRKILKEVCQKNNNIKYIRYNKNHGVMKSIFTAINNVTSDACAVFDCDLQDTPELLLEFIKNWENGYKIVYGKRLKRKESFAMSFFRNIFKKFSYTLRGYDIEIESGAFFLDKNVIQDLKTYDFDPFLPALIERLGFSKISVKYDRVERKYGQSKFNFFGYLSYAFDGLISGTIQPLRISIFCSFLFALISFISAIYFLIAKFYLNILFAEGIAAIIIINLFSFSLIFLFFGILGEYIGKIFLKDESKKLPKIAEKFNL